MKMAYPLKSFIASIALLLSSATLGALIPTVNVVELESAQFRAPAHEADIIELQPCNSCAVEALQVTGATVYRLNGFNSKPVKLTEMQRALRQAGGTADLLIYVAYDARTLQVNEIIIGAAE